MVPPKRGKGRPRKHGAYDKRVLAPVTNEMVALIENLISGERTLIGPTDRPVLELLARALAKVEVIDRWLAENGLFSEKGDPQPVLKIYWHAVNTAVRLCDQLGLTPASRVRLGVGVAQAKDIATQIRDA